MIVVPKTSAALGMPGTTSHIAYLAELSTRELAGPGIIGISEFTGGSLVARFFEAIAGKLPARIFSAEPTGVV